MLENGQEIQELEEYQKVVEEKSEQKDLSLEQSPEKYIEELVKQAPDIPEISFETAGPKASKKIRAKKSVCFCHEDLFDSENVHKLLNKDYQYFLQVKKYNSVLHFNHNQEPFSYMYERESWNLRLFDKFQYLLREFCNPLKSGPFSFGGRCVFFEFETLYNPTKCCVYVGKSYDIVKSNINRFNKVSSMFNRDTYEDILVSDMDTEEYPFDLPSVVLKGSSKIVYVEDDPDSFVEINANRNNLPVTFFGEESELEDEEYEYVEDYSNEEENEIEEHD